MKKINQLITLGIGATMSLTMLSCNEAKEKMNDAKEQGKEAMAMIPKDAGGVTALFEKMNSKLESVKDLESAKKAMPDLEKIGNLMKKGQDAMGGKEKMHTMIENASPEVKEKFGKAMGGLAGHMKRIKEKSPEAFEFIDKKMEAILGK